MLVNVIHYSSLWLLKALTSMQFKKDFVIKKIKTRLQDGFQWIPYYFVLMADGEERNSCY